MRSWLEVPVLRAVHGETNRVTHDAGRYLGIRTSPGVIASPAASAEVYPLFRCP